MNTLKQKAFVFICYKDLFVSNYLNRVGTKQSQKKQSQTKQSQKPDKTVPDNIVPNFYRFCFNALINES